MALLAAVLVLLQQPVEAEIDEALSRFEEAAELERALTMLSAQLAALGTQATNPIAQRLAQDLRDGMASAAAPALIDALVGRPDALAPLQAAFRDAGTTAAGRIELAEALLHLDDARSWRTGLLSIASDGQASLTDRLHASKVLLETDDAQAAALLRGIVEALPERTPEEQRQVVDFLRAANTPVTRELLGRIAWAGRAIDEPQVEIIDDLEPSAPRAPAAFRQKKSETRDATFLTMPSILVGGVTLVLLVLLGIEVLRKG
jgi:hypothetical protein